MLRGRDAILAVQPLLAEFVRSTGQTGEADSLAYFLSTPDAVRKIPCLILVGEAENLLGAVLLFEYRAGFGRTRVFATADGSGRRDVLARPEMRAAVAAFAARTLVEMGAQIVHLAFSETHLDLEDSPLTVPSSGMAEQAIAAEFRVNSRRVQAEWTLLEREIPAFLPLLPSFNQTLARIGQRTRSNLRYYRRRAELDLGCTFEPRVEISREEFLAFNRECSYAVEDSLAEFRYRMLGGLPNAGLRGIRDREGRWLSLVGLRRQNRFAEIDWQMNRADLPAHSLATVLRSYLIEHEIAQGSTRLYIEGGTPQPIIRSFAKRRIAELTVRRDSWYVRLLERFASVVFPPKNYVGQTLINPDLHWKRW
jgi:hypothetical protein